MSWIGHYYPFTFTNITTPPTMSVIIILLLASISVAALFLVAFLWSVKTGQYNDEMSPPMRMLLDSVPAKESTEQAKVESL